MATFWATFWQFWATLYSIIWSHWNRQRGRAGGGNKKLRFIEILDKAENMASASHTHARTHFGHLIRCYQRKIWIYFTSKINGLINCPRVTKRCSRRENYERLDKVNNNNNDERSSHLLISKIFFVGMSGWRF